MSVEKRKYNNSATVDELVKQTFQALHSSVGSGVSPADTKIVLPVVKNIFPFIFSEQQLIIYYAINHLRIKEVYESMSCTAAHTAPL